MLRKILMIAASSILVTSSISATVVGTKYTSQNPNPKKSQPFSALGKSSKHSSSLNYSLRGSEDFTQNTDVSLNTKTLFAYNGVIYAGGTNGLYESIDNGAHFEINRSIPLNNTVTSVCASDNVVYVATANKGIFASTNNGKTFVPKTSILNNPIITSLYAYKDILYAGTKNGLYESEDNAQTWTKNKSLANYDITTIYAYNNIIYVGILTSSFTFNSLWESTSNGAVFTPNSSITEPYDYVTAIYAYKNIVYVGTNEGVILESSDNGKTFPFSPSIPRYAVTTIYAFNNTIYYGTPNGGVWQSNDNGKSFAQYSASGLLPTKIAVTTIYAYNDLMYVGTNGSYVYESASYARVSQPQQVIDSYNNLLYNSPIYFNFDWTILSQVTIVSNKTSKQLNGGNYEIKEDGIYTVTFKFQYGGSTPITKTFNLQNGRNFNNGINTTSFTKGKINASGEQIWNLDIYLNGLTASRLKYLISPTSESGFALIDVLGTLVNSDAEAMGNLAWHDFLSNQTLRNIINNDGSKINANLQNANPLYDALSGSNLETGARSILNYDAVGHFRSFAINLVKNIYLANHTFSSENGIDFHFQIVNQDNNRWKISNFDYNNYADAYNSLVKPVNK